MANEKLMDVDIVTPQKVYFSGKAESVAVPGSQSPFQVLYNHAPIVSSLDLGIVRIVDEKGKNNFFATGTGFVEVSKNKVSILVENASEGSAINIDDTNNKLKAAKEQLAASKNQDEAELAKQSIKFAENLLKAYEKAKEN